MNDILQLKGTFTQQSGAARGGPPKMPADAPPVESKHLDDLLENLKDARQYWSQPRIIDGILLDTYHTKVMPKSSRISDVFMKGQDKKSANDFIVGSRFSIDNHQKRKHVITYYIDNKIIDHMIGVLRACTRLLNDKFGGRMTGKELEKLRPKKITFDRDGISLTTFRHVIVDSSCIEKFNIPDNSSVAEGQSIITIYKTEAKISELMKKMGINVSAEHIMSDTTMLLQPPQLMTLKEVAPYLIAMSVEDESKQSLDKDSTPLRKTKRAIVDPNNEPIVGVIDTMFDERVYFSKWVDFRKMISDQIPSKQPDDYNHGTAISSIIVDGPALNPEFDDGCGRFRVRHFGVAVGGRYSSFEIMKKIKLIVENNLDIKVWNLSLGSNNETNLNSISPEAAMLDDIQYKRDVIFVIAGTNKQEISEEKRIGSPADSLNSIVVNSVNNKGQPSSYSRKGLVLSFFNKPDVSSYGGDDATEDFIRVYASNGECQKAGTSFAAPWVTRKIAYLIEVLGFSRETAKALIVDAATGWDDKGNKSSAPLVGHGVVPIRIEEVVQSPKNEIKFVISGTSEKHHAFNYNLPVPHYGDKYPFIAKATLCYFPKCSMNQGVDYTNTEMDIYLGRMKTTKNTGKVEIKSINKNTQSTSDGRGIHERDARSYYRKWDNTKHICESYSPRVRARVVYEGGRKMWGIGLRTKERLTSRDGAGIKFGIVVTLREITGVNRIDDFVRQCIFHGWLVNKVDIESKVEIYDKTQQDIEFDES